MDIEELAADMGPTAGLDDPPGLEQSVEAGECVGVQHPGERLQVSPRMLALAIGRIEEDRRRRSGAAKRTLGTNIGPQPTSFGLAAAWRQYWHGCVVAMQRL